MKSDFLTGQFSDLIKKEYGIELEKQAPRKRSSNLVPKKVQVKRGGRVFERTQMVRPAEVVKPSKVGHAAETAQTNDHIERYTMTAPLKASGLTTTELATGKLMSKRSKTELLKIALALQNSTPEEISSDDPYRWNFLNGRRKKVLEDWVHFLLQKPPVSLK